VNGNFTEGCLVIWAVHGIYGVVESVDFRRVTVRLDNGETQIFSTDHGALERVEIGVGSQVTQVGSDLVGVVIGQVPGLPNPTWRVQFPDKAPNIPESTLRPAVIRDPLERFRNGYIGRASDFNLKSVAADLWTQHLHNELVSLDHARVDLKPHQVGVVHRVISNYPHRFLLCDEVGLGKTIEAAMVIKELKARKQASRILILVPSSLQLQWQFELKTKFNEVFSIFNRDVIRFLKNQGEDHPWTSSDQIIVSHSWAAFDEKRRDEIASLDWDLIIVDEAHHAREQRHGSRITRTNLYRLVRDLVARPEQNRRAALFLTATPMQLQRHELYSLVEMLDPILFASEEDFVAHIEDLSGLSQLADTLRTNGVPDDVAELEETAEKISLYTGMTIDEANSELEEGDVHSLVRQLEAAHRLSEVLIRNRRAVVGGFQPRHAYRWKVTPTDLEQDIYRSLQQVLKEGYALAESTNRNAIGFLMSSFQRLATSSNRALLASLKKRRDKVLTMQKAGGGDISITEAEDALDADQSAAEVTDSVAQEAELDVSSMIDLIILLERVQTDSKTIKLVEELHKLFSDDRDAKVLIFTQFRETQEMLREVLEASGSGVNVFHGQLDVRQKDQAINRFREATGPQILISTEAGGEGRNLQFCHLLVNYDLPWNPMKVEQRIGRVDRIGQDHPVSVFNLYVEGTIEERVLDVLEHRIKLFNEAIGGLEPIIGDIEADIRKALRLAGEVREEHLARLAEQTEKNVMEARKADRQMADLILDKKSSYGAAIARVASEAEELVSPEHYEEFLKALLASANTYLNGPDSHGVYKIQLHSPVTVEWPHLVQGQDRRRVCFDPRSNVDSENVEYMGFGHALIDALVESRMRRWAAGNTAIRRISNMETSGWQFNWLVSVGSVRDTERVHASFVSDSGEVNRHLGAWLLYRSRFRDGEEIVSEVDIEGLDAALLLATQDVGELVDELTRHARETGAERADEERARVHALSDYRKQAAADKVEAARATLAKLERSTREQDRIVIPPWRAKVQRAEAELEQVEQDRNEMLAEINRKLSPTAAFELLNVARIVGADHLDG
jgi:ERCC4-related helicase